MLELVGWNVVLDDFGVLRVINDGVIIVWVIELLNVMENVGVFFI